MTRNTRSYTGLRPLALLAATFFACPALADIDLRVESWPNTDPIEAFVRVTDGGGSVTGLTADDFAVTLDGSPLNTFAFGLPPDQDSAQHVSVVFVLSNGGFSVAIQDAVRDFINQMAVGDYAAIVKTRYSIDPDLNVQVVQPFTQIDGGTGTNTLINFATVVSREGWPKLLDALMLAVEQFETLPVPLPNGPKAIIVIGRGRVDLSRQTVSDVVFRANENGIPIFAVETGDNSVAPDATARMASLAADTGGTHIAAAGEAQIARAYVTLASLLNNAYRLTIPEIALNDCDLHMLGVTALGQSMDTPFARCDTTPDHFAFTDQINVATGSVVVSDPVMITGIDGPTAISVIDGEYSIGCVSTFTTSGSILPNEEVCVRHTASATVLTSTSTTLIVGGVSALFTSTTGAGGGGGGGGGSGDDGGGGGGGGSTGVIELLLALGALFARKKAPALIRERCFARPTAPVVVSGTDSG